MPRHVHRDAAGRFCKAPAATLSPVLPAAAPAPQPATRGTAQRWLRPVLALGVAVACVAGVPPARPSLAWSPQAPASAPVAVAAPSGGSCARLAGRGPHAWQVEAARLTATGTRVTVPALRLACGQV